MRTIEYGSTTTHVPAFLTKLWKLVTDTSCDDLISWSLVGTSFIIYDEIRFSKELLPMYFKHNNMASFVRQLNMYGFRKLSCIDQGGMHCYKNEIEFYHQYFIKGKESMLELIKRKIPSSKTDEHRGGVKQEYVDELVSNFKALKGRHEYVEHGMRNLKRENRMLWRHVNLLTDRYSKQQTVLQQLLPFFVNMVRSSREMALKRKAPLMIDEGEAHSKMARMSPPYYVHHDQDSNSTMPSSPGNVSNRGPVIHDVTEMEGNKMFPGGIHCEGDHSPSMPASSLESSGSPLTEPVRSMDALNILNQNYESRNRSDSVGSHFEMKHSPNQINHPSPPMPSASSVSSSSYCVSPSVIIDENTSDVPLVRLNPYAMDSNTSMYAMMGGNLGQPIIDEDTCCSILTDGPSPPLTNGVPSPIINDGASTSGATSFVPNMKEMNWMMNGAASSYSAAEPSFENWLGQIFKSDNLTAGCSLPQTQEQVDAVNFV